MAATDAELITAYQSSGDQPALETLLRRHIGRVRAIIYSMIPDNALADDLTQETLLRAVKGLPRFRHDAEFSTWLCSIAMNCVRSHLARRPSRGLPLETGASRACSSTANQPENVAIRRELDAAICGALEQLTPKLRAAVVLISLGGLDAARAAAVEGCTAATMHSRLHEARKRLKQLLKDHL